MGWISNRDNAVNIQYHIVGQGSTLDASGTLILKSAEERKSMGFSREPSDLIMLSRNLFFGKDHWIDNYNASYPDVPREFFQAEFEVNQNKDLFYDAVGISASLPSDQYVPFLQTLIVEFVFKTMNAPAGQFERVYQEGYKVLLDNHLQDVLDDRAAWYDANK